MKQVYFFSVLFFITITTSAQISSFNANGSRSSAIVTAVPFLTISPDARSGGMGDVGAATSPDASSTYWNPSKMAFIEDPTTISLSYSPWMRRLYSDVNMAYLTFVGRLDDRNTFGASLRYFNLGKVDSYDENINSLGTLRPNEFSLDVSDARKFGDRFSMGLTARYIRSDLTQGAAVNGIQSQAASAFAADVSLYYVANSFSFGANISNIGTKMSYTPGGERYFLPTNLKIGIAKKFVIDDLDEFTLALDANKLLVPTPPVRDDSGNIIAGKDDNRSVVSGIFGSFSDAPGGLKEELQEISLSPAFEYWYQHQFALRAGYFYENPNKGGRQYITLGTGFRSTDFKFDFSYLVSNQLNSPLAGVVRFSVAYNFGISKIN